MRPSAASVQRTLRPRPEFLLACVVVAATPVRPAGAAPIPHSQARAFHSTTSARQIDTYAGTSAAVGGSLVALGSPLDDIGGENSGVVWVHDASSGALLQRLDNPEPAKESYFGWSVAVAGSLVAVGVPEDNTGANDAGLVYVYNLASSTPTVPAFVIASPAPAADEEFGWSVALSGSRLVVGVPGGNAGAGRLDVFDLAAATPATPLVQIANPDPASMNFGHAAAIDGDRVAASALQDLGTAGDTCRIHVFDLSTASPGQPVLTAADPSPATNDQFGHAVAVAGTRIAASAPLADVGADNAGTAYVFDLEAETPAAPVHEIPNPTPAANGQFGSSLALTADRLVVGAPLDDLGGSDSGVACIFDLGSATPAVPALVIGNPSPSAGDEFGSSLAISGNRLLIAAPDDNANAFSPNTGIAFLFDLSSGSPSTPLFDFNNPSPSSAEEFSYSVAISGNLVAVGAQKDDKGASNSGSVSLFDLGTVAPEQPWLTIENPSPATNDYFGTATAVSGTRVAVCAYQDDTGANNAGLVYIYDTASSTPAVPVRTLLNPSPQAQDQFGNAVAISGDLVVVGCAKNDTTALDAGSVYIYDLASATPATPAWTLDNPSAAADDQFGHSVAISGTLVVVGAHLDDGGAPDAGSGYVYDLASATPTAPVLVLANPFPAADDEFACAVAISGPYVLIGCRFDDVAGTDSGAAYLYNLDSATPAAAVAMLAPADLEKDDAFGSSVALSGTRAVVGAPESNAAGSDSGCGYVFEFTSGTFPEPADRLVAEDAAAGELLGFSAAVDGSNILLGAPLHDANTVDRGAAYLFDPDPPAPQLQVEQPPGTGLVSDAASVQFGNVAVGGQTGVQTMAVRNVGTSDLVVTGIAAVGGDLGDFSVLVPELPAVVLVDEVLHLEVTFTPATTGTRLTTLRIDSNAGGGSFEVALTGQGLSSADDTDGDGLNDVAELALETFGFDWQVNDEELLLILGSGANSVGLFNRSQVQAMHPDAPVIAVRPETGRFKLTLPVEASVDLMNFELFPVQAAKVAITPQGGLDIEVAPSGDTGFFRFAPR